MKMCKAFLLLVAVAGIASSSVYAGNSATSNCPQPKIEKPQVVKAVQLSGLPYRFFGSTLEVAFTLDEHGQPSNIKVLSATDARVEKSVLTALAQWRFTPAQRDGVAVASKVVMPLQLI